MGRIYYYKMMKLSPKEQGENDFCELIYLQFPSRFYNKLLWGKIYCLGKKQQTSILLSFQENVCLRKSLVDNLS
jgi:hypothetical protein